MPHLLFDMLLEGEAEAEVLRLAANRHLVKDLAYFWRTSDRVADGRDPVTGTPLTGSGLKAWSDRCQRPPCQPIEEDAQDQ